VQGAVNGTVVLTGAAGRIGRQLRPALSGICEKLLVVDQAPLSAEHANETAFQMALSDLEGLAKVMAGANAVVHFAGYPREADWDTLLQANIVGAINLWEAARRAGVERIVYASSNHAVGMYPRTQTLSETSLPCADSRYGVTKVFMETLAQLYAVKHGIRGFGMRIGHCAPEPTDARMLSHWIHPEDMFGLVEVGLKADYSHEVVFGASDNACSWWNNDRAKALGFCPRHSADGWISKLQALRPDNAVAEFYQGGSFAAAEFDNSGLLSHIERARQSGS
jgi:uronate dehydrogenase